MKRNLKSILTLALFGGFILIFCLISVFKPDTKYSYSERRTLADFPSFSFEDIASGKYISDFEAAAVDQFPARDFFRSVKAYTLKYVMLNPANHDIYLKDGYLSKLEYPLNESNVKNSLRVLNSVYDDYIKGTDCKTYLSVIPDKNRYLAADSLFPTVNYPEFIGRIRDGMTYAEYIDISDRLSIESFYLTDQHWKQEAIVPVADTILEALGRESGFAYKENRLAADFYGAYAAQSALKIKPETILYLTNDALDACSVTSYSTGKARPALLYDLKKGAGRDAYEIFLQGSEPLLVITNPLAKNDGELIVFRDSFGSSLVPLLIPAYQKITVVDLRYMNRSLLPDFIDFDSQDVLFLYSTLILNNAISQ